MGKDKKGSRRTAVPPRQEEEARKDALKQSQRRQAEISALLEASSAVLRYREFPEAARAIFNSCKSLIGAAAGYLALLSKDGTENEVLFLDSGGLPCTVDPSHPMPIRGLREQAYRTGKAVYHNDFFKSEWVKYMPPGHATLDNVLFAPLTIEGKTVGLLGLANKPGGFTQNDARLASAFGELAAVALRNSRTLEELEHSEERFRSVAQTAKDAVITVDRIGNIVLWNRAAEITFGYSADEAVGQPLALIMPERFHEKHEKGMKRVLSNGETKIIGKTVEMTGLRRDGSEFPLELSIATWKSGEEVFFTGILRDIAERKRAEQALRESEEKFRSLAEQSPNMIFINNKGRVVYANERCEEIMGYSREEFYSPDFDFLTLIAPESKHLVKESFSKHTMGKEVHPYEYALITKEGEKIEAILTARLIRYGGEPAILGIVTDITERKRAERALRESEERFRQFFENEPEYCYMVSSQGRILNVNRSALAALGYEKGELIAKGLKTIYSAESHEKMKELLTRWRSGESIRDEEMIIRTKRGEKRTVLLSVGVVRDKGGRILHSVSVQKDITERKRAEEALRTERDRAQRYLDIAGVMMVAIDADQKVMLINKKGCEVLGYDEEDILSNNWFDCFLPDRIREEVKAIFAKLMAGEIEPVEYFENPVLAKGGDERIIAWHNIVLTDEAGHVIGTLSSGEDVTERKRAEEELRKRTYDLGERVKELNCLYSISKLIETPGMSLGQIFQGTLDLIPPAWQYPEITCARLVVGDQILTTGNFRETIWKQASDITVHGYREGALEVYYLEERSESDEGPFLAEERSLLEAIVERLGRVVERKRAEQEIQELNESLKVQAAELAAANKELEAFSYSVSHDLRAPLIAIDGFSRALLEDYANQLDEQGKDYLNRVRAAGQRMGYLIDDLLNLSLMMRKEMRREEIDLGELARSVAAELQKPDSGRQVQFVLQEGALAYGDPRLLRAVLENLLGNAWKFTEKRSAAKVEFGVTQQKEQTVYFVRDNGAGFDMRYADRLFVPFQRLHSTAEFSGNGIGLTIASRIINRHGGRIWADSEVEKGATFYFTLK